ncbi:MAG: YgaP-like transmembrane domain [Limisphaerales bacterium]
MSRFFQPNIDSHGRLVRGGIAAALLIAGGLTACFILWLGLAFVGIGIFTLFEAVRGWCIARACGIKTKV